MTVLRYLSVVVLALVLGAAATWFWLLHTESGARFAWGRAEAALAGNLSATGLSGSLGAGLNIDGFRLALPGVEMTAELVSAAVDVDLVPLSIEVNDAAVSELVVELQKTGDPDPDREPPSVGDVLERLRLPVWLRIDDLAIDDAEVRLPEREQPVVIERAALRADWRDRIFIDRLEILAPRGSVSASGMLVLTGRQNFDLAGSVTLRPSLVADDDEISLQADVAGHLARFTIEGGGEANIGGRGEHTFSFAGAGQQQALDVESFSVSGADLNASGSGRLALDPALSASASIELERADPSPFVARWPAGHPLTGRMEVDYEPGYLRLGDTQLSVTNADARLTLAAVIDIEQGDVRADLEWQHIAWPLGVDQPAFSSRTGDLEVGGSPDDWRADGSFSITLRDLEETVVELEGRGNRTRAGLTIADAKLFGGSVAGSASVAWAGERPWAVNLYATDIETGTVDAEWPGRLSGLVRASGHLADAWLRAAVVDVDGALRGRRFTANGGISLDRGRFVAHELSLEHGDSRVRLDGAYWSPDGIGFEMSIADIGHYLDDSAGAASGSGRLSLYEPSPFLRLDASAERLRVGEVVVSGLEIDDRGNDGKALQAAIRARDISIGNERLIEPRMLLGASPEAQVVRASARYADLAFDMRLEGAFDSWKQPTAWRGFITALEFDAGEAGRIELREEAAISVSADAADLSRLCLAGPDDERLCAQARWAEGEQLEAEIGLNRIPVALANLLIDTGYQFDQRVSGDLSWSFARDSGADGAGELTISPGRIVSERRPARSLRTGDGRLTFDIEDGQLLAANVSLPMPGTGTINGRFEVADIGDLRNSGLGGRLEADLDDITVFAVFLPDVDALDGRLRGTLDIGGTVAEPLVTGTAKLEGGRVDYLPIGLELRDADLDVEFDEDYFVAVSGSVRAGEGRAVLEPLEFGPGMRPAGVHVAIRGQNLTVVSVPDVSAQSDIDMTLGYDGSRLTLGGRIDVVRARIEPETLPASKQTVSDDVVIVAGELPGEAPGRTTAGGLEIHGELAVSLGPDVRLRIDVATATVSGTTTFAWNRDPMPVANGRYVVSGEVQTFGILLRIDEGTVRFPNVAANNPILRIRAEREIFGNTEVRQAGVLIEGTLARPSLTPYTDPPTTEERALTLLVTGSDFNLEEGVGAIDFGTYIAPRLYVSYGISLFGQDNVISARYDLTEGFGIRATSGQTDSGVDLVYRIER